MQQDEVVWKIINDKFCSFKVKTQTSTFCRNEYNVTGLCTERSCPLANSQYATVREYDGRLYLLKKVVERAHLPSKMWERIPLSTGMEEAKQQIAKQLEYWPGFIQQKCRLRLERMTEVLKRTRRIANSTSEPILIPRRSKKARQDRSREDRAIEVARLETVIEKELMERLQKGVYGEIYNFNQQAFDGLLSKQGGRRDEMEEEDEEEYQQLLDEMDDDAFVEALSEDELESELEGELEDELDGDFAPETEMIEDEEEAQMLQDLEDLIQTNRPQTADKLGGARKRTRRVEVEYEESGTLPRRLASK